LVEWLVKLSQLKTKKNNYLSKETLRSKSIH
jgi:hypothetical protein